MAMSLTTVKIFLPDFNHIWNSGQMFHKSGYQNSQKSARTNMTKLVGVLLDHESAPKGGLEQYQHKQ